MTSSSPLCGRCPRARWWPAAPDTTWPSLRLGASCQHPPLYMADLVPDVEVDIASCVAAGGPVRQRHVRGCAPGAQAAVAECFRDLGVRGKKCGGPGAGSDSWRTSCAACASGSSVAPALRSHGLCGCASQRPAVSRTLRVGPQRPDGRVGPSSAYRPMECAQCCAPVPGPAQRPLTALSCSPQVAGFAASLVLQPCHFVLAAWEAAPRCAEVRSSLELGVVT